MDSMNGKDNNKRRSYAEFNGLRTSSLELKDLKVLIAIEIPTLSCQDIIRHDCLKSEDDRSLGNLQRDSLQIPIFIYVILTIWNFVRS